MLDLVFVCKLLQGKADERNEQLRALANIFDWEKPDGNYEEWLYEKLSVYPPMKLILKLCRGNAISFKQLAIQIFAGVETTIAEKATETLLALGPLARENVGKFDERVLLPSRVHLLFKGLKGVFACINPNCSHGNEAKGVKIGDI